MQNNEKNSLTLERRAGVVSRAEGGGSSAAQEAVTLIHAGFVLQNNEKSSMTLDDSVLKGMVGFFDLYDRQAARLDDNLHDLQLQQERLQREMTALKNNLQQISSSKEHREARSVT